ncbi:MAG: hypothetical protein M3Z48_06150, partial [Lactobacillus sp.]|nr:hypothetical protein [Lactobacillus sp.]
CSFTTKTGFEYDVTGFSYFANHITSDLIAKFPVKRNCYTFGIMHAQEKTSQNSQNVYAPFKLSELQNLNYDYFALGHIHLRQVLAKSPLIVYPGNIQGRHINETGPKGCYLGTIDEQTKQTKIKFVQTNPITWMQKEIELTEPLSKTELEHRIVAQLTATATTYFCLRIKGADLLSEKERELVQDNDFWQMISAKLEHESQLVDVRFVTDSHLEVAENDRKYFMQAEKEKKRFQTEISQQKQKISDLQLRIKNFTELNHDIQSKLNELDPQIAVYANKLENITKQISEKRRDAKQQQKQIATLEQKLNELKQNDLLDHKKQTAFEQEKNDGAVKKQKLQKQLNSLSSKLGQYDAQINQLDQVASRNYDLRKDAAVEQKEYSVKIAQLNSQIDQRLDTLSSDYSLTYEAALNQAEKENTEANRAQLQKDVKLHRMSIADIGPVNLKAIEEYDNVKKRYDFLNAQQNDLLKGRDNLEESMSELDQEVCNRFKTTFTAVAKSFNELFPVVFGGGSAKLVLTDPDHLLATGIEIIAQPPGKKLQRLSLLSGGERALTAITLLFAMLKVKPVPFCVLDEVEAALDDSNVTRFANFLEEYDMHTQFIVITHRRGTMERADQLYGVV